MELHKTKIDIEQGAREKLIGLLNQRLADAADLKSQAKQAHWNVKGANFIALHELFDQVSTEMDTHVDDIAERITTLGGTARISFIRDPDGNWIELSQRASLTPL